jgi:hypothetical protein
MNKILEIIDDFENRIYRFQSFDKCMMELTESISIMTNKFEVVKKSDKFYLLEKSLVELCNAIDTNDRVAIIDCLEYELKKIINEFEFEVR